MYVNSCKEWVEGEREREREKVREGKREREREKGERQLNYKHSILDILL